MEKQTTWLTVFLRHFKNWVRAPTLPKFSNHSSQSSTEILKRSRKVHEIEVKTQTSGWVLTWGKFVTAGPDLEQVTYWCNGEWTNHGPPTYEHISCFLVDLHRVSFYFIRLLSVFYTRYMYQELRDEGFIRSIHMQVFPSRK